MKYPINYSEISNLISGNGIVINGNKKKVLELLSRKKIISIFEKNGIILFKNFNIKSSNLIKITDQFTQIYSSDALRRKERFNEKRIRNVDFGIKDILLHSESSFNPAWPEIIWFYCVKPPKKNGETTICDGIRLWQSLSFDTKNFFLLNPIQFKLKIPIGKNNNKSKKKWLLNTVGSGNAEIDWKKGNLNFTLNRFAVQEGRDTNQLCFANHLFVTLKSEPQILSRTLINGKKIPSKIIKEIKLKAKKLTYLHKWNTGDFLMIDNKRFMHGRNAYDKNDKRDIVNIQSLKANFAYGVSMRRIIKN